MSNETITKAYKFAQDQVDQLKRTAFDQKFKFELGEQAREILYLRTKSGIGVDNDESEDPKEKKLDPLSKSYKAFRAGLVAFFTNQNGDVVPYKPKSAPILGPHGSPNRSNLTLSGEMLESIRVRVGEDIVLEIPHSSRKDGKTNHQIWEFTREGGRHFFAITVGERNILTEKVRQRLTNVANQIFA